MLPLEDITVVSLEQAVAAPFATRQLADLGARVIKVERPGTGDFARSYDAVVNGLSSHFVWLNRSKESLTLDLKKEGAREVLERLRAVGVSVAIDDFGTGYSSLAQLQQLPADEIKIDRSFVRNMRTNPSDAAIVRSTIALGRNLSLEVTAEGVESEEICRDLSDLGCDFAQGYFLGRSVPADECERDIRGLLREQGIETGPRFRADVNGWVRSA